LKRYLYSIRFLRHPKPSLRLTIKSNWWSLDESAEILTFDQTRIYTLSTLSKRLTSPSDTIHAHSYWFDMAQIAM
jgi:hypothetical protein